VVPALPGLAIEALPAPLDVARSDLTLALRQIGDRLDLELEYSSDLFEADTAERLVRHLAGVLDAIGADPDQRLSELRLE
jgi:non-ribosomal peptide synthetase component F